MSNSTQPVSFFQGFLREVEGNVTNWTRVIDLKAAKAQAAKIAYKTGIPIVSDTFSAAINWDTYVFTMATDVAYRWPKIAMDKACWLSRWVYWLSPVKPPAFISDAFSSIAKQIEKYSDHSTSWITGKTIEEVKKDYLNTDLGIDTFTTADFIRSTLVLGLFTNQALSNLFNALHHSSMLLSGKRLVHTAYKTTAATDAAAANMIKEVYVTKTRQYSTISLLKCTGIETLFAGLWGSGAYYSYYGIRDAVEAATKSSEQASFIANIILATAIAGPILLKWVGDAINDSPADQKGSPKNAQQYVYTDDPSANPARVAPAKNKPARLNIGKSSEKLNFSDAVKLLEELRGPSENR